MKKTKLTRSLMAAVSIVALSAVMYGCVHSGDDAPQMEAPDLTPAQNAAAMAATAAMAASDAAAAAVAGVDAIRSLDAVAYLRAENAAAAAMAASADAAAASAAAAAATTLEDAEAAQAAAEAAQAAAVAAQANAEMQAGIVQAIKDANDEAARIAAEEEAARIAAEEEAARIAAEEEAARIAAEEEAARIAAEEEAARQEAAALSAAQMAASDAADAAKAAAGSAQAELDGQMANADADADSYAALQAAAQAASDAYMAAMAASDAAAAAAASADAAMHQATAEAERDAAQAALADAVMYAGMVQAAQDAADVAAAEAAALSAAQMAANTAATDAAAAATAANDALTGLAEKAAQDQESYAKAVAAASTAQAASQAAAAANQAAMLASTSAQAQLQQSIAEAEKAKAESAQANAEMYAGMVSAAYQQHLDDEADAAEAAALMAAQDAANEASTAAMNALTAATEALAGLLEKASHDPNSYTSAVLAQGRAQAAAQAAADAARQADAADNSTDAQGHQATAEAEQAKAESAQADAEMYAGMVNDAYNQYMAQQADEEEKIALARTAAEVASTAAAEAAGAADTAFMAIDGFSEHDEVSHALAKSANEAAQAAKADAAAALADAMSATSSAAAQAAQKAAEAAQTRAESARMDAETYASVVQTAYDDYMAEEQRKLDVAEAQTEAATAAGEARMAADDAATEAAGGIALNDPVTIGLVQQATTAAAAAEAAAMAASETDDLEEARKQRDIAQGKQTEAENAKMAAVTASDEAVRHANIADPTEAIAIVAARRDAAEAARDAQSLADQAQAAANAAEMADPGSQEAMDAQDAADDAQDAADAAEQASEDAMAADNQADAEAAKDTAEEKEGEARTHLTQAETARNTAIANSRILANTKTLALAGAIQNAKDAAQAAKDAADQAVLDAEQAVAHAGRARTDVAGAEAELEKAKDAQTAAEKAVADAAAAEQAVNDATTTLAVGDAENDAADAEGAANDAKEAAEMASREAMMAAERHVIDLLIRANGQQITEPQSDDSSTPLVDESMTVEELQAVATVPMMAALNTAAAEDDNGEDGTTAMVGWPGDIAANPDATPPTDAIPGALSITVTPEAGTALTFRTVAAEDDPATDGVDESMTMPMTAGNIAGLGDFQHGFSISDGTSHAIVFTDKTQDDPPVAASAAVTFRYVEDEAVTTVAELALGDDKTGPTYTGVTWTPSGEVALTGTLACPEGTVNCDIQINDEGEITALEGYVFTGSREAKAEVTAMDAAAQAAANNDYLVFGVWLKEDGNDDATVDDPQFGAFANGGSPVTTLAVEITGTATYNGSATGVYTAGSSVDYFQGDATLTADFGTDAALGSITGRIHDIVAGEGPHDDIHLGLSDQDVATNLSNNIAAGGTFSGRSWMGEGMLGDDGEPDYPMNGSWSGQFFNGTADDTETADVNESHVAPDSVAGTFGVTGTTGEGDAAVTRSYLGAFGANTQ